jgi:hypothetical protein
MEKLTRVFMDKIDWECEIDGIPTTVYPSLESLEKNRDCLDHCGIVEVEVKLIRIIKESKLDE